VATAELTIPDAIAKARQHLKDALPEYENASWQLEEAETDNSARWYFTFSIMVPPKSSGSSFNLADLLGGVRLSKSVELEPQTGKLLAIRNRAA
jgi:hypothetical protein